MGRILMKLYHHYVKWRARCIWPTNWRSLKCWVCLTDTNTHVRRAGIYTLVAAVGTNVLSRFTGKRSRSFHYLHYPRYLQLISLSKPGRYLLLAFYFNEDMSSTFLVFFKIFTVIPILQSTISLLYRFVYLSLCLLYTFPLRRKIRKKE